MMRRLLFSIIVMLCLGTLVVCPTSLWAHGVVGKRFFVESVSVDDPFASDEMDLLAFSHQKDNDNLTNAYSGGISKRLSPNLGFGVDWEYDQIHPNDGSPNERGFQNLGLHVKYMMVRIPEHEFIATAMLDWEAGHTGSKKVGSDPHSTATPTFLFGYGFGDLPDALSYLQPFAITGAVGISTPINNRSTDAADIANDLSYGLVLEYSILYLQSYVKDIGIGWPFNRLVPMVEMSVDKPINGPDAGKATGNIYPGITWAGRYYQLTVEAIEPLNSRSGHNTGVQGLIHLYLDDMFPKSYTWTPFYGALGGTQR